MANNNYWIGKEARAKRAAEWTTKNTREHSEEIRRSVANAKIYDDEDGRKRVFMPGAPISVPVLRLLAEDSVTALCNCKAKHPSQKVAVLNFASYKNPGGMFLKGSRAQEECLCHESFLYNVLCEFEEEYYSQNRKTLRRAMYTNRAIYAPDVHFYHNGGDVTCDVITCAAPNFSAGAKYANVDSATNSKALFSRIRFVLDVAAVQKVDTLVLGAFGCGVFGQNPTEVAEIMRDLAGKYPFAEVIFAIPDPNHENYVSFAKVFDNH